MPSNLDLLVGAAEIVKLSVGSPAHQIPGAIHPGARIPERTGYKPCRRQRCSAHVAEAHTPTCDIQLADDTGRYLTQPFVEHE
ncbi:Uncharacterised protein [Mycobacteroides abscessus subsp. abscessus]|nr:Uncharacterised protein [Mycobacteroides abscessus subsp. abscessus]SLD80288.1 Uncharacterised protein [Mycobacteroides abscessus subsp. massiliense]